MGERISCRYVLCTGMALKQLEFPSSLTPPGSQRHESPMQHLELIPEKNPVFVTKDFGEVCRNNKTHFAAKFVVQGSGCKGRFASATGWPGGCH